ncbi:unnamed protein product [Prorocentrum cordatum]|uniref:Uncharacterized protein n=1 Tax=Prorocentrum cordatum TaxID=2364126 RepID=A0ABN9V7A9_9DINO|nr:unnamed protein product [Polarella glacialis]|mmetsp:Transcript_110206/g.312615  ORF Transcript_110206/g.312615 Transcript_110206/m.312615 type:complete len:146 (+) Transcript_110206:113-550(+)
MAPVGSVMLLGALLFPTFEVQAVAAGVLRFESFADAGCSELTKTEYVKAVTGSTNCYVYSDANGDVSTGASSFTLTCEAGNADATEYDSESCTGSAVSSGTQPWFIETMCTGTAERFHRIDQELTVHSNYGLPGSTCSKAYFASR